MSDYYISRQSAIDAVEESRRLNHHKDGKEACSHEYEHRHFLKMLIDLPFVEIPTLKEKALSLLLDWAIESGFGYDNIPEEYAMYEKNIENMSYKEGLIYIAEKELERNERHDI